LSDRFALQDVMASYARGVDERDFERYRTCFADSVEVLGFTPEPIVGADAWVAFAKKALEQYTATQHLLGLQLATIDGDRAHARTDVQAQHFLKEPKGETFTLWATYETDLVRNGERWQIAKHRLVRRGAQRAKT
jgi:3-phenylpropionate/cinnamic acid dioxygenase small subunit